MKPRNVAAEENTSELVVGFDLELDEVLRKVLQMLLKEYSLSSNQILTPSSELQRLGVHRLVEEHLRRYSRRQPADAPGSSKKGTIRAP